MFIETTKIIPITVSKNANPANLVSASIPSLQQYHAHTAMITTNSQAFVSGFRVVEAKYENLLIFSTITMKLLVKKARIVFHMQSKSTTPI